MTASNFLTLCATSCVAPSPDRYLPSRHFETFGRLSAAMARESVWVEIALPTIQAAVAGYDMLEHQLRAKTQPEALPSAEAFQGITSAHTGWQAVGVDGGPGSTARGLGRPQAESSLFDTYHCPHGDAMKLETKQSNAVVPPCSHFM